MENTGKIKMYSFDVFDTVLTRRLAKPRDIFLVVGRRLRASGIRFPEDGGSDLYSKRIWAEFIARRDSRKEDITISDIYAGFERLYGIDRESSDRIMNIEMETEMEYTSAIASTLNDIEALRFSGAEIAFISDMYLPTFFIKDLLVKVGAYKGGDRIYVSGDYGLSKSSGRLFSRVLIENGLKAYELCHFGDNFHSDVSVPAKMGIKIFKMSKKELRKTTRRSQIYLFRQKVIHPARILLGIFRDKRRTGC